MTRVLFAVRAVSKAYGAPRPLRMTSFDLHEGESVALVGLDRPAAEVLVNLLTGTAVPDSGDVRAFGALTSEIADGDEWLRSLDRVGIFSERAVLLDDLSVRQNLAMPFTLDLDPVPPEAGAEVEALAREVSLTGDLDRPVAALDGLARARVRLARAVALRPAVLFAEHPNALVSPEEATALADDLARAARARGAACLVLTMDRRFAEGAAERVLAWDGATGEVRPASGWRRWLAR
ncbi:MAG: ATP-binding cassette domain-containing protein [Acidimicrobiia bacterium]|nr:ATP-binding cassette domain-containing protein [Acidimicrobiia bacterium]